MSSAALRADLSRHRHAASTGIGGVWASTRAFTASNVCVGEAKIEIGRARKGEGGRKSERKRKQGEGRKGEGQEAGGGDQLTVSLVLICEMSKVLLQHRLGSDRWKVSYFPVLCPLVLADNDGMNLVHTRPRDRQDLSQTSESGLS